MLRIVILYKLRYGFKWKWNKTNYLNYGFKWKICRKLYDSDRLNIQIKINRNYKLGIDKKRIIIKIF